MPKNKHLSFDDRSRIHAGLNLGHSFRKIALQLDKDPSTISKEVRRHSIQPLRSAFGYTYNKCIFRASCSKTDLCAYPKCNYDICSRCNWCNKICQDFQEDKCSRLSKPPYVCNGCVKVKKCRLTKAFYRAIEADKNYREVLSESRKGISFTEDELNYMDDLIAPLVKKKQSLHHICVSQADKILCSERTIYKLVDQSLLSVRNIDLPRKVRYRPRHNSPSFKVDRDCRNGRTYEDFLKYLEKNPDTPVVQMDSVIGSIGGKVLLTTYFTQSNLMLMYLRDRNTSQSVIDVFNTLDKLLGRETFMRLFPVVLTDNGSEFSNPKALEYDSYGNLRTRLFYCNPSSPYQKPDIERNHEFIRMVLPKGRSFDALTQMDVDLVASHINSLIRKKLNDRPPTVVFSFFYGDSILRKLGIRAIPPDEVTLSPALLSTI